MKKYAFSLVALFSVALLGEAKIASATITVPSTLGIYVIDTPGYAKHAVAVVRQEGNKAKFYSCDFYPDGIEREEEVRYFFQNSCYPGEISNRPASGYLFTRHYLAGSPYRKVVFTQSGTATFPSQTTDMVSEAHTWTTETFPTLGGPLSQTSVLLVGARVTHEKGKNPVISTQRHTYALKNLINTSLPQIPN